MKRIILLLLILMNVTFIGNSQENIENYRRNSLCVVILEQPRNSEVKEIEDLIYDAAYNYEISDKYNNHSIGIPVIQYQAISELSDEEFVKGIEKEFPSFSNGLEKKSIREKAQEYKFYLTKYPYYQFNVYVNNRFPQLLIKKWFNGNDQKIDNSFYNMSLIQERGAYNASELDLLQANESIRGINILKDAGMELIPNTYVVLIELKFEKASDVIARKGQEKQNNLNKWDNAIKLGNFGGGKGILGFIGKQVNDFAQIDASYTAGYYVTAITYLYQLEWNEEIENNFIQNYYYEDIEKLTESDDFKLKYVGRSSASVKMTEKSSIESRDKNTIKLTTQATVRAIDESIANLQREYEDFRVKAPIIEIIDKDVTSFIGLKEGLTPEDKFEVLEKIYNPKKNIFEYKKVGNLKIDKNRIWDNRFYIEDIENLPEMNPSESVKNINRTYFKGGSKKMAPGMLIRQTN